MATPKLVELPSGAASGSVPTVQPDGTVAYVVPTVAATIDDTTASTTKVWSSSKTQAAINAVPTGASAPDATTTSKGVLELAGDLTGTAAAPTLITVGTAGTYGSSTKVPVLTTDNNGRVTNVAETPFSGFYFWDGTSWGTYPTTTPCVFFSIGYTGVTGPTNAADNSVWFYSS